VSPRRRLDFVELRSADCLGVDEIVVVRPAELRKYGEGFDVRTLRR
jgi:hypothetical protein